jgi:glycosyltransferase involved in cell wall biosynthesis
MLSGGERRGSDAPQSLSLVCFPYTPSAETGRGIDRISHELLAGLRGAGLRISVLEGGDRFSSPLDLVRRTVSFCWRALRTRGGTVHALDPLGAVPFLFFRRGSLIVTIHDLLPFASPHILDPDPQRLRFYIMRVVTRVCLAKADLIFVPFQGTRNQLIQLDPSCESKIRVIPYGLTPPEPVSNRRVDGQNRARETLPSIVFIGGGQPVVRGGSICLRALRVIRDQGVSARLSFVGSGPQMKRIKSEALTLGLGDSVSFLPAIPEGNLLTFIRSFDLFVYPSELGFSLLVLQAMMVGTPVVTSDARDLEEFLGGFGVICSRSNVESFAKAIRQILLDPELRATLSSKGLQRAEEFTAERMTRSSIKEYSELRLHRRVS